MTDKKEVKAGSEASDRESAHKAAAAQYREALDELNKIGEREISQLMSVLQR